MNEKKSDNHPMRVIASNPVLILFLGACPAMAQTARVMTGTMNARFLLFINHSSRFIRMISRTLYTTRIEHAMNAITRTAFDLRNIMSFPKKGDTPTTSPMTSS